MCLTLEKGRNQNESCIIDFGWERQTIILTDKPNRRNNCFVLLRDIFTKEYPEQPCSRQNYELENKNSLSYLRPLCVSRKVLSDSSKFPTGERSTQESKHESRNIVRLIRTDNPNLPLPYRAPKIILRNNCGCGCGGRRFVYLTERFIMVSSLGRTHPIPDYQRVEV